MFFADDSTLLSHCPAAAQAQMLIVDEFCKASGAALNVAKCVTILLDETPPDDDDAVDAAPGAAPDGPAVDPPAAADDAANDSDPGDPDDAIDTDVDSAADDDEDDVAGVDDPIAEGVAVPADPLDDPGVPDNLMAGVAASDAAP
ncbi:hypothetical protein ACHHYP_20287 [Achlya hypogyna]|uniref:Reverse transcriptase domain-containing protein n=1 Tax=Achlya hypogyna TaxID=1202772 RepID=A0A1V9YSR7_ACHHY|nr:hypothetical protein ACHHYP_20287 [Achlya hypogyna]